VYRKGKTIKITMTNHNFGKWLHIAESHILSLNVDKILIEAMENMSITN